jgi:argininosuccinate lyase
MKELLGFSDVTENSIDTASDRSYILETLFALALILQDLSRIAEDFIIFASREFKYITLDDTIATSSSLMPQKKNPDFFELIRPAPAKIFGYITQLFITIKGLPSTYDKDLQEDKVPLYRGVEDTMEILQVFNITLSRISPNKETIEGNLDSFLCATDLADYLTNRGIPFREAHGIIGAITNYAEKNEKELQVLTLDELKQFSTVFDNDVHTVFDFSHSLTMKKTYGSTNPKQVKKQIKKAKALVEGG